MITMTAREIRDLRDLAEILKDCSANEENLAMIRKAADALQSQKDAKARRQSIARRRAQ